MLLKLELRVFRSKSACFLTNLNNYNCFTEFWRRRQFCGQMYKKKLKATKKYWTPQKLNISPYLLKLVKNITSWKHFLNNSSSNSPKRSKTSSISSPYWRKIISLKFWNWIEFIPLLIPSICSTKNLTNGSTPFIKAINFLQLRVERF